MIRSHSPYSSPCTPSLRQLIFTFCLFWEFYINGILYILCNWLLPHSTMFQGSSILQHITSASIFPYCLVNSQISYMFTFSYFANFSYYYFCRRVDDLSQRDAHFIILEVNLLILFSKQNIFTSLGYQLFFCYFSIVYQFIILPSFYPFTNM